MPAKDGKPCKKCGTNEWYKNGKCAECSRRYSKMYYQENHEEILEISGRYREKNRAILRRRYKKHYQENKAKRQAVAKKWQEENPELTREYKRKWQRNNRDKRAKYVRKWRRNNPHKSAAIKHKRRAAKKGNGGSFTGDEFKRLCEQYDHRCISCGKKKKLTADHVVPVSCGGSSDISNIQPLCRSCNTSKGTKTIDYRTKPGIKRWIQKRLI